MFRLLHWLRVQPADFLFSGWLAGKPKKRVPKAHVEE